MKKLFITMFCLGLAAPLFAQGTNQFADENSRASYALGMMNGSQWKAQDAGLDPDVFMRGLKDGLAGGPLAMTEAEARQTLQTFSTQMRTKQFAKLKLQGETFLATNKMNPGIKMLRVTAADGTSSELQYLVISNGTGPMPKGTDTVSVNYRGTMVDGTEFDSSYKRGAPASSPVGGVIKGWTEALKIMPVGSKWKLFIPSNLAYGEAGQRGIPPNSVLIFDVELLAIVATPPPQPPPAPLTSDIIKVPSAEELKHGAKIETNKAEDLQKAQAQQAK